MSTRFKVLAGVIGIFLVVVALVGVYFNDRGLIGADEITITRNISELLLEPSDIAIDADGVKTVTVALNNGSGAELVRFRLLYDPAVIAIEKVVASANITGPVIAIDNNKGELSFQGQMALNSDSLAAIALLRLKAKSAGTTSLSFSEESPTPLVFRNGSSTVPLTNSATITVK